MQKPYRNDGLLWNTAARRILLKWIRESKSGALFIPYRAGQIAALRQLISTWMRIAIFETMNTPDEADQRLWFVIDELDEVGQMDGLKDEPRKFGGRCVLGFQDIAQVRAPSRQRRRTNDR